MKAICVGLGGSSIWIRSQHLGAELQLLHMAMQVAYKQLQGPLSSQEEYGRASRIYYGYKNVSALLQTYIVDDVTRARLATVLGQGQQLTFDDINLLKDIDKKTTHPGILVARHAIGGSLSEALLNLSLMRMARGWKVMASGGTGSTLDDLARVNEQKLLENQNKPIGLLPPPGKKGVETKTIYVDSEGNASVGKLPPERGGKTYYVDPEGRIYTSLDYIKVNVKAPAADKLAERIGGVYSYLLNECYDHPVISNDEP